MFSRVRNFLVSLVAAVVAIVTFRVDRLIKKYRYGNGKALVEAASVVAGALGRMISEEDADNPFVDHIHEYEDESLRVTAECMVTPTQHITVEWLMEDGEWRSVFDAMVVVMTGQASVGRFNRGEWCDYLCHLAKPIIEEAKRKHRERQAQL